MEVLQQAVRSGDHQAVSEALKSGVDIDSADAIGEDAWRRGRRYSCLTLCSYFLTGMTALHIAAVADRLSVLQLLLNLGADPNMTDLSGRTPLHHAAARGLTRACTALLEHGAQVTIADRCQHTPSTLANTAGQTSIVGLLEAFGELGR